MGTTTVDSRQRVLWGRWFSILTEASVLCVSGWATVPELSWDFLFCSILALSLGAGSISLPLIVINKAISRQGEMSLRTSRP